MRSSELGEINTIIGYTFLYSSFLQYSFILDNQEECTLSRYILFGCGKVWNKIYCNKPMRRRR